VIATLMELLGKAPDGKLSSWHTSKQALPTDVMDYGLSSFSKKNLFFGSDIGQPCHLRIPVFRWRSCGVSLSRLTFANSSLGWKTGRLWVAVNVRGHLPPVSVGPSRYQPLHCCTLQHRLALHPYL